MHDFLSAQRKTCLCAGGGVTQIVMPYMTEGIAKHVPEYEAWRWAFFLPGCLYIIITFLILTLGQVCICLTFPLPVGALKLAQELASIHSV